MCLRLIALCVLAVTALALPSWAHAAESTLQVSATAAVVEGKVGQALLRAKADALRSAIEQVMGLRLQSRVIIKNELLVSSRLVAYTSGGIKGYRVLKETREPGLVRVVLLVTVTDRPRDMAQCPACGVLGWPRFRVVSAGPGSEAEVRAATAALTGAFSDRHLKVAAKGGGDVVIRLSDWRTSGGFDGTGEQARVSFLVTAELASTGLVLASQRVSAQVVHPERAEALGLAGAKAGRQAARELFPRLAAWWNSYLTGGLPIVVLLKAPVGSHHKLNRFISALERIPGAVEVRELSTGKGQARLLVRYKGPSGWLRREVIDSLHRVNGFAKLRTETSSPRRLVFTLL